MTRNHHRALLEARTSLRPTHDDASKIRQHPRAASVHGPVDKAHLKIAAENYLIHLAAAAGAMPLVI